MSLHLFLVCLLLSLALFFFWSPGVRGLFFPALHCVFCSISLSLLLDPFLFHPCPPFLVIFYTFTSTKPQDPLGRGGPFSVGHLMEGQVDFSLHAGSETCSELLGLNFQRMDNISESSRSALEMSGWELATVWGRNDLRDSRILISQGKRESECLW